jgi:hypothetical protein
VIDRTGLVLRTLPQYRLGRTAAPVWLNDDRIAAQTEDRTTYRWFDLPSGEQGDIVDRLHCTTSWLARSPVDGTLVMWRWGTFHDIDHLYLQPVGQEARPLHVDELVKHHLLPAWSRNGELLVRALETGEVSRVALDSGARRRSPSVPRARGSRGPTISS